MKGHLSGIFASVATATGIACVYEGGQSFVSTDSFILLGLGIGFLTAANLISYYAGKKSMNEGPKSSSFESDPAP